MLAFDSIYLDSEALVSAGWPNISAPLRRILNWANRYGVSLFLPEATEMELEEHWYRDFIKLCEEIKASEKKLKKFRYIDMRSLAVRLPDEEVARRQYKEAVRRVKEDWGFQSVPLTRRNIEELFGSAIRRVPPFKEEGAGFQDTVIYLSVINHLRETGRSGAYLSNDGIFKKERERILQIASSEGVKIRFYRTPEELEVDFNKELSGEVRERLDELIRLATTAIEESIPELEEFLFHTLEIPKAHPFTGDVVEVQRIEVLRVEQVLPSFPREGQPTAISIYAVIKAHVLLDTSTYDLFRVALAISARTESESTSQDEPVIIPYELEYRVEVEASGIIAEGRFQSIELLTAKIKTF